MIWSYIALFTLVFISGCSFGHDIHDEFPKDDYKTFFKDLNEALGLERVLDTTGSYFRSHIRIGLFYYLYMQSSYLPSWRKC